MLRSRGHVSAQKAPSIAADRKYERSAVFQFIRIHMTQLRLALVDGPNVIQRRICWATDIFVPLQLYKEAQVLC